MFRPGFSIHLFGLDAFSVHLLIASVLDDGNRGCGRAMTLATSLRNPLAPPIRRLFEPEHAGVCQVDLPDFWWTAGI